MEESRNMEPDRPRRITLSEIVDRMLNKSGGAGKRSSVTIGRSASGDTTLEVTVSAGADEDTATIEDASKKAQAEYDRLTELYPVTTHEGASVDLARNAKGETQVAVSIKTSDDRATLEEAGSAAQAEYDRLRGVYPMANGQSAAAGSVA